MSPSANRRARASHRLSWAVLALCCAGCGTAKSQSVCSTCSAGASCAAQGGWPMPNAPGSGLPNPQSYDLSSEDVVVDRVSGLLWQRNADPATYDFNAAGAYCAELALDGQSGWRAPSLLELVSIVDVTRMSPAIDPVAFPNTPSLPFWSSDTDVTNSGLAWYVYFDNGGPYGGNDIVDPQHVRCVRGP